MYAFVQYKIIYVIVQAPQFPEIEEILDFQANSGVFNLTNFYKWVNLI